jgi:uncharacterized protein YaeQ
MALKSTIYKAELQLSDMDRQHYEGYNLTLAQHPSENDERMMVRLLAFALNATPGLEFTRGLSTQDEPDLWLKDLTGDIALWIDLGQPDEKRLRKAAGRSRQVVIYTYSGRSAGVWWEQVAGKYRRFDNLTVIDLDADAVRELGELAQRSMRLQCSIQDGEVWLGDEQRTVHIVPRTLKAAAG